jgi:hypothetical protein
LAITSWESELRRLTGCQQLIMLLRDGVFPRSVEIISRRTALQHPRPAVLIDRDHHCGLTAQVYGIVSACGIRWAVKSRFHRRDAVTFGMDIGQCGV